MWTKWNPPRAIVFEMATGEKNGCADSALVTTAKPSSSKELFESYQPSRSQNEMKTPISGGLRRDRAQKEQLNVL